MEQWVNIWLSFFGLVLDIQALFVWRNSITHHRVPVRILWTVYASFMAILATGILIGYALNHQVGPAFIVAIWYIPLQSAQGRRDMEEFELAEDESSATKAKSPKRGFITRAFFCCSSGIAWSSLFFLTIFGALCAMQALWIGHDAVVFPPPGIMYSLRTSVQPYRGPKRLHFRGRRRSL